MTVKCSVFIATSLDGFIARLDGDISWLTNPVYTIESEEFGISEFYSLVDTLVIGRKSYETALGFPDWPYSHLRVFVLSHTPPVIPPALVDNVVHMTGSPRDVINQLAIIGASHVYVDGGKTIQGFLRAGLINEMTITTIPVLLGSGIPLFGPLEQDIPLQVISSRVFPNGFVQTKYGVTHSNQTKLTDNIIE